MNFEPGINCVVGPNGSGKSNVVDALAWVMGEQGAKTLRGAAMQDVIFAGTAQRPALGRAEVQLTIDNTDGRLPIEYSEVTISRTMFRSGGSEYAINGTAARLLDIQELLSDSGLGREMHVIIGQGRLDQVLTATPEERRGFIEEAAGVLKHRRRKEKALRKLESMRANLTRLEDLSAELRRQLGPLARQAATARRAQTIQAEVFDARARLLADDLAQAQARLDAEQIDDAVVAKQRSELAEIIAQARQDVSTYEHELETANPAMAHLNEELQRLSSLYERFRSLEELSNERVRAMEQAGPDIFRGESPEHIRERRDIAQQQEDELRKEVSAAADSLNNAIAAREASERTERETETELTRLTRTLADQRENQARLEGNLNTAQSRLQSLNDEMAHVSAALETAVRRVKDTTLQVNTLEQEVVAHSDADDSTTRRHEAAARTMESAKQALGQARDNKVAARSAEVEWRTKADTLELSLAPDDASAWAAEHENAVQGLVRTALHIVPGWETAIETALGQVTHGVVVGSVAAAVDVIRAARDAQAGHVEILVQNNDSAEQFTDGESAARVVKEHGFDESRARLALDVVTPDSGVAQALGDILAGVVVCADLVTARDLVEAGVKTAVTIHGEIVSTARVSGGEQNVGAVLARAAMFDDAVREAENARDAYEQAEKAEQAAEETYRQAKQDYELIAGELAARDSQLAAASAQLGILRQTLRSAEDEVKRNENRIEKLTRDIEVRSGNVKQLSAELSMLNNPPEDLQQRSRELKQVRDAKHADTVQARLVETEARLSLRTKEERLRAIAGKAEALEKQARSVEQRIDQEHRLAERRKQAALSARAVGELARRAGEKVSHLREAVRAEYDELERTRAGYDAQMSAARKYLDRRLVEQRDLDDLHHRRELALAEIRLSYEQLMAKAIDDVGIEPATLVEDYGPHNTIELSDGSVIPFVREQQEKRLARAEKDLARLGKINSLALEEHAALEERHKYLSEQLQDLRKSREDLLTIISDIDERVEQVMRSAFDDVSREFTAVFSRLFPGGEGKLVLTDPDSILTTGIDIEARPPGKRVKRLSLLSGGERSLTAIGFLVAIFKARPSPFYVMDEVEAALDDVNLSRLLNIFRELQASSQLIVITHQKRTMEIADTLYGVAMKEKGVTSVISQRLKDVLP